VVVDNVHNGVSLLPVCWSLRCVMRVDVSNGHLRQAWASYQHAGVDSSDKTAESGMHAVSAPMVTLMSER